MQFLLSHWHCILPVLAIGIAFFFMRKKPKDKRADEQNDSAAMPQRYPKD